jgi:uncharacterized protein YndB with AHSA1/START domain
VNANRRLSPEVDDMIEDFVISRTFDAPRDLVWKCFTDPGRMKHWWGPKGFKVIASKMDLRPGGIYHYGLQAPNGQTMWGKFVYREITPQDKIVFISSFSDERGGTTRHPGNESWPLTMLSTFMLGAPQCDGDGVASLRLKPQQHDAGLERYLRAT